MGVYELIEDIMIMGMGNFEKKAGETSKQEEFDASKVEVSGPEFDKFVALAKERAEELDDAAVGESGLSTEELGKQFLFGLYGNARFSPGIERIAGTTLKAFREGNFALGKAGVEQLTIAEKKMGLKKIDESDEKTWKTPKEYEDDMHAAVAELQQNAERLNPKESPPATE